MHGFLDNCQAERTETERCSGPLTTDEINKQHEFWIEQARPVSHILTRQPSLYNQTKLVQNAHQRTLHGGVRLTMAKIRKNIWVPILRKLVKKVIKRCHGCQRFHVQPVSKPPPGNLPIDRTQGLRPFQVVGVDFAGPSFVASRYYVIM